MRRLEPSDRREILVILAWTIVGAGLRFGNFGQLGLNHFDEGVYALAGLWPFAPGGFSSLDPIVIPYAPPGFPFLVGLAYLLLGAGDGSAILVSTLCGIVSIPVAAWIGRRTFGPSAGAATAAFAALSMPHLDFSRKALTDVPFGLVWLMAIGLGTRFLEKATLSRAIALGLVVGVAQLFKYNGWLTGAIVATTAFVGLWRPGERSRWLTLGRYGDAPLILSVLAVGISILTYSPWYLFVERHGGYQALLSHHRSYVGGLGLWPPYWRQQHDQLIALSGGAVWCAASWVSAWIGATWARSGFRWNSPPSRARLVSSGSLLLLGAYMLASLESVPWWLGVATAPWLLLDSRPAARSVGCWWLLLSSMTPFYHPYARLWLPLHSAGWLLLAGLLVGLSGEIDAVGERSSFRSEGLTLRGRMRIAALAIAVTLGLAVRWTSDARPFPVVSHFRGTSGLRDLVAGLAPRIPLTPGRETALVLLGRRPLAFYLLLQGRYAVQLVERIDDATSRNSAWALVDGALLDQDAESALTPDAKDRVVEVLSERLDPVTLLDVSPAAARSDRSRAVVSILILEPSRGQHSLPRGDVSNASSLP